MKKRILFVITQLYRGGAEVTLVNLLSSLDPNEYEIDLIMLSQEESERSLIGKLPEWIRLCDAGKENRLHRLQMTEEEYLLGGKPAREFVEDTVYDLAISYGEWCPLSFVARSVKANRKAVWIHTDITAAKAFDAKAFFDTYLEYRYYIFVSERTKALAEAKYPFLVGKSVLIHNYLDRGELMRLSETPVTDYAFPPRKTRLITVANVRTEKGFPRMLETAYILKNKGVDFVWVCIGAFSDAGLVRELKEKIHALNLSECFVLLGDRDNPHPYTRMADVFVLLSDYEAWPLAMAEALLLGKPAIATRTAGSKTHIVDGKNGLLCGFNPQNAADAIERFCTDTELAERLKAEAAMFKGETSSPEEFREFAACCQKATWGRKGDSDD